MRYLSTTGEFCFGGRPRPGFPLLLADNMEPVEPAQEYLTWKLLERGRHLSPLTWDAYGRRMWDYFSFLAANGFRWEDAGGPRSRDPITAYRDWSLGELQLDRSTVNARIRLVLDFYRWAAKRGLIDWGGHDAPLSLRSHREGMLSHLGRTAEQATSNLVTREWERSPEFLSLEQVRECRNACLTPGERLLFDLMVRVGLRASEARTFPVTYIKPVGKAHRGMIHLRLQPKHMELKFQKERVVDVPADLMEELHLYAGYERNRLSSASMTSSQVIVLNRDGHPFSRGTLIASFGRLSERVGYRVRPLMLRHSYAVHTLAALRRSAAFTGEPLLYVRDRMGHSSIQTTAIYLRQVEQLEGSLALAMDLEFSQLFGAS